MVPPPGSWWPTQTALHIASGGTACGPCDSTDYQQTTASPGATAVHQGALQEEMLWISRNAGLHVILHNCIKGI